MLAYYHTVHDLLHKEFNAQIKLSWESDDFDEEVIPTKYLYTRNEFPTFQPMDLDQNEVVISNLDENSSAFKNSIKYFLQDIPQEYRGLPSLKFITRFHKDVFEMTINSPKYLYVGVLSHYPNPLPDIFEYTNTMFSIVKVDPKTKVVKVNINFEWHRINYKLRNQQFLIFTRRNLNQEK